MANKLHVSSSPHIHSGKSTQKIMLDVIIALLPATIAGTIIFGLRSLLVIGVCIGVCVLCEFLFNKIVKKDMTITWKKKSWNSPELLWIPFFQECMMD